ncbi:MAG: hypothetical protein NVS1B11_34280 [Terriglobales bacterium]
MQIDSILAKVGSQLSRLEKRDWELWVIASLAGLLICAALLVILLPPVILGQDDIHFEFSASPSIILGLVGVIAVLNIHLAWKRLELRGVREQLVSKTIHNELVRQQSYTDPLTEIYNRHALNDVAGRLISQARRTKKAFTILLIDVDRFKDVNTKFGHLTGDMVLADTASLLKSSVRGSDAVFRYGGDEFLVILAETTAAESLYVINRIRMGVKLWNGGKHLDGFLLTLSIGAAEWCDGQTLDELLDSADRDMYGEKVEQHSETAESAKV